MFQRITIKEVGAVGAVILEVFVVVVGLEGGDTCFFDCLILHMFLRYHCRLHFRSFIIRPRSFAALCKLRLRIHTNLHIAYLSYPILMFALFSFLKNISRN